MHQEAQLLCDQVQPPDKRQEEWFRRTMALASEVTEQVLNDIVPKEQLEQDRIKRVAMGVQHVPVWVKWLFAYVQINASHVAVIDEH
jgi:hypothetical protein